MLSKALPTCFLIAASACGAPAFAQAAYPSKSIRIVVPFVPGGTTDIIARVVGQKLAEAFAQPVVVDNRAGAGGVTGTNLVAKATPDGYTLLLCSSGPMAVSPALVAKFPHDPVKDIAPVVLVVTNPYLLLVGSTSPFRSVKELIARAKARPGELNFGSAGVASTSFLATQLFKSMAQIDIVHVPYKGSAQAQTDVAGGQLQLMFDTVPATLPMIKANRLRPLGVSTLQRFELMPELPTIAEAGVPGYEASSWSGICAPGATPQSVIATLNREIVKAIRAPEARERFAALGAEIVGSSPQQFGTFIRDEIKKWAKVVADSGAKVE